MIVFITGLLLLVILSHYGTRAMSDGTQYIEQLPWPAISTDSACIRAETPWFGGQVMHLKTIQQYGRVAVESMNAQTRWTDKRICDMDCQDTRQDIKSNRYVRGLSIICPLGLLCETKFVHMRRKYYYQLRRIERKTQKGFCLKPKEQITKVATLVMGAGPRCAELRVPGSSNALIAQVDDFPLPSNSWTAGITTVPDVEIQAEAETETPATGRKRPRLDFNLNDYPPPEPEEAERLVPVYLSLTDVTAQRTERHDRQVQMGWEEVSSGHRVRACIEFDSRANANVETLSLSVKYSDNKS